MKIALVTQFLPRMEIDHIVPWIDHHIAMGVDKFLLYNNGLVSIDDMYGGGKRSQVWAKKPEANYHLELRDEQVLATIDRLLQQFPDSVIHKPWPTGIATGRTFCISQMKAVHDALSCVQSFNEEYWLGHIDIDELLVAPCTSLTEFLGTLGSGVGAIRLSQKLFGNRFQAGQSIPFRQLTQSYGVLDFNHKLIARTSANPTWTTPHDLILERGCIQDADPESVRFHHFRGAGHFGPPPPSKRYAINKYMQLNHETTQFEVDTSHILQ